MGEKLRVFIGLGLPEQVVTEVSRLSDSIADLGVAGVKTVPLDGVHCTLWFIGDVTAEQVPYVQQACEEVADYHGPVNDLELGSIGGFPELHKAEVLYIQVQPWTDHDQLEHLHRALGQSVERWNLGPLDVERFDSFIPHITLARVKTDHVDQRRRVLTRALMRNRRPTNRVLFGADRIVAYQSFRPDPPGSWGQFRELFSVELKGG